jgi:DNA-binding IclR family transcriptional regulator
MPQPVVTALLRGLDVLRCFTEQRQLLGSSEIARLTGLSQPTVWRLCKTLEQAGYLLAEPPDNRFRLGLPVLTLGFAAISALDFAELARPILQPLASTFDAAAGLTTREQISMLCLQRVEAPNATLTVNWRVGSMVPIANSGVGWAYLSGLSVVARETLLAEIKKAQPDLWRKVEKACRAAMNGFAQTGYVVNADILYPGLTTVALSMTRSDGTLFVLNCTALSAAMPPDKIRREIGPAMKDAAKRLSSVLARSADGRS